MYVFVFRRNTNTQVRLQIFPTMTNKLQRVWQRPIKKNRKGFSNVQLLPLEVIVVQMQTYQKRRNQDQTYTLPGPLSLTLKRWFSDANS